MVPNQAVPASMRGEEAYVEATSLPRPYLADLAAAEISQAFTRAKVIKLSEEQVESFTATDAEYNATVRHLTPQNTLPTVERFSVHGIYFTVVNYTTKNVAFVATDEEGEHPYRLLLDSIASQIQFSASDTLLVFYPAKSEDQIYSICKDRLNLEPLHRIQWTIYRGAYKQFILYRKSPL